MRWGNKVTYFISHFSNTQTSFIKYCNDTFMWHVNKITNNLIIKVRYLEMKKYDQLLYLISTP